MKIRKQLTGMMLMLIIAGTLSLSAQGSNRESSGVDKIMSEKRQRPMMLEESDSLKMRASRFGNAPGKMICPYQYPGSGRQNMRPHGGRPARGLWHSFPGINNIPDLTDNQKKEIAILREKQQTEMQKLREEMQTRITDLRESNRKKIMDLLTEEQRERLRN
jgi:hypothetical protein